MNFNKLFFSFVFVVSLSLFKINANAAEFYRHIPIKPFAVDVALQAGDTLIIDYDFSRQKSVRCTANSNQIRIDFVYKGHQKFAFLPVTLQNSHVPKHRNEELADASGQLSLSINKTAQNIKYEISCRYSDKA